MRTSRRHNMLLSLDVDPFTIPTYHELQLDKKAAIKADLGKNQLALLPLRAIEQIGLVMTYGAEKYSANNWRKGFKWTRLVSASMRHLFAWCRGEDLDPESGISHIAHSATNLLFLLEMIITSTGEDDRYLYPGETNDKE